MRPRRNDIPRQAWRQAGRQRRDIACDHVLLQRHRPRLIRYLPIRRVEDDARTGLSIEPVGAVLLDVLRRIGALPVPLYVRHALGGPTGRERLDLLYRTGMKFGGIGEWTSRGGTWRLLGRRDGCGKHRRERAHAKRATKDCFG